MFELVKKYHVLPFSAVRKNAAVFHSQRLYIKFFISILTLIACLAGTSIFAHADEGQAIIFELSELTIVSANNRHHFRVELANTKAAQARGLMERRHMDDNAGMLFDFEKSKQIHMWMKNTYIPLDMLFIDRLGNIVGIAENTTPLSSDVISSPGPVLSVLELKAGTASRLTINTGDKVLHEIFKPN